MDEERRKRTRRTTIDQLEEERISPLAATIENESDENETITSDDTSIIDEDFSYSDIQSDLEFLDYECDLNNYEEMEEDDVDPDELSYEELIALGEMVGVESKGLSEVEIRKHLNPFTCQSSTSLLIDRCVICQVEYKTGEELVSLNCHHPYHSDCITKWLQIKKICAICGNEVSSAEVPSTSTEHNRLM